MFKNRTLSFWLFVRVTAAHQGGVPRSGKWRGTNKKEQTTSIKKVGHEKKESTSLSTLHPVSQLAYTLVPCTETAEGRATGSNFSLQSRGENRPVARFSLLWELPAWKH